MAHVTSKLLSAFALMLALPGAASALPAAFTTEPGFGSASGWLAGAQIGYNWQQGAWVYGFETDVSGTALKSDVFSQFSRAGLPPGLALPTLDTTARIDWYGTFRGRFGVAIGSFLVYGTGGLAYGGVDLSTAFTPVSGGLFSTTSLGGQTSSVKVGWVAGAGVDYLWTPNLTLKLQYQYVDLGSLNLATATPTGTFPVGSTAAGVHAQFQAVTLGVSWRFQPSDLAVATADKPKHAPPAVVSNPWQGLSIGGRAGGAWGNGLNTNSAALRGGVG